MSTYVVTRHKGALDWLNQQTITIDDHLIHLDPNQLQRGDTVIGNLPVPMVAELTERGIHYWHLSFEVPFELRGVELSAEQLNQLGICLKCYQVQPCPTDFTLKTTPPTPQDTP